MTNPSMVARRRGWLFYALRFSGPGCAVRTTGLFNPHIRAAASGDGQCGAVAKAMDRSGQWWRPPIGHWDGEEEARWIGEEVEAMQRGTRGNAPFGLDDR